MDAPRVRDTLLPRSAAYYTCVSVDPELPGGFLTECGVFGSNTLGHRAAAIDGNVHGYVLIELPSGALETEIDIIREQTGASAFPTRKDHCVGMFGSNKDEEETVYKFVCTACGRMLRNPCVRAGSVGRSFGFSRRG